MPNFFKGLALKNAGLRQKLTIAFCLMSLVPLLITSYIVLNFVLPYSDPGTAASLALLLSMTLLLAIQGYTILKLSIGAIIDLSKQARVAVDGDTRCSVEIAHGGEIGDLANSLNVLIQKTKGEVSDLSSFSAKTREISADINKKVIMLSGLLQVGNLISGGTDLKTIMDALLEKIALVDGADSAVVMRADKDKENLVPITSINFADTEAASMPVSLHHGIFEIVASKLQEVVVDKQSGREDKDIKAFRELYDINNFAAFPILLRARLEGVILVGNNKGGFEFKDDDVELLRVFCKQAAVALENDSLTRKTQELEVKDDLTGLYNNKYIKQRLDEEINRAVIYQRPCSFILFNIDGFKDFCERNNRVAGDAALKKIGDLVASELSAGDKAARFSDDEFAIVLPERNKKEARQIADEIKTKISELIVLPEADESYQRLTVCGSLTQNPIDGASADELIKKARELLGKAKAQGKNTIKV